MNLDFSSDGYENLFKKALSEGINLFCGAGFSVESFYEAEKSLPTGVELLKLLKEAFPMIKDYTNLPRACTKIKNTDKQAFYSLLENYFSVKDFNPAYSSLLKINLKNIYTTNIDDLFFKIFEKYGDSSYLNDCSIKGEAYTEKTNKNSRAVNYFPLHGCIRNERDYVFGTTEIASAFSQRDSRKWESLANDAAKHAILFWGWNFDDSGPLEAMYGQNNDIDANTKRWVLLRTPNNETYDFIKSLNFNIIIGDTLAMLNYLSNFVKEKEYELNHEYNSTSSALREYEIPKNDENLTSYPLVKFFIEYSPRWSHIYSGNIPKMTKYKNIENSIASGKNLMVIGIRGAGKTTLCMQLLVNYNSPVDKHILIAPSKEEAQLYIKQLRGNRSILFVDDCFRDTDALIELFKAKNIQIICFDRDFNYELQYYKIKQYISTTIDVTDITQEDAQRIIDVIPFSIKRANAGTKNFNKDPTILNLLAKTLVASNFNFMKKFYDKDALAAKVFLMIAYVHSCGTPCSFDMVYSFLDGNKCSWKKVLDIIKRSGGLLKEVSWQFEKDDIMASLEDFYQCRSRFLAEKIIYSIPKGYKLFAEVISEFTRYVPEYKICSYDKFKRNAYDADIAMRAFPDKDDGTSFYELCAKKDGSEYVYQQAAIYFSRHHEYKTAFNWIERARNLDHYNRFSIDSTYAQIYFDVNLPTDETEAASALEILALCCKKDQRKSIHFAIFARCCLKFHEKYGETLESSNKTSKLYLSQALSYLNEGLDDKNLSLGRTNKRELAALKSKIEAVIFHKIS